MNIKAIFSKFIFTLLLATICQAGYSQVISIGTGTANTSDLPTNTSKNYNYSQQIYTSTEVGSSAPICGISFYRSSTGNISRTLKIYLGHTTKTIFNGNADWIPGTALTLVFSGSVQFLANQWTYINFDIPFYYEGVQNIVIAVDDDTQIIGSTNGTNFRYTTTTNKALYYSNNNTNPLFTSPPTGTRSSNRNNIKIHKCQPSPMSNTTVSTCDHLYADPGGINNYGPNQNFTQTFVSASGNNNQLLIHFMQFSLASGDTLWIYNGGNITTPLVGVFTANNTPFDFTAIGGSITIRFKSDGTNESAGWLAYIYCRPCNPISIAMGSPCYPNSQSSTGYAARPFCTDENPNGITFPSATSGNGSVYLTPPVGCLSSVPRPAWYFMQINSPGNMLIYIEQNSASGNGMDVDFACWGPFYADNQTDFMQRWCCGGYDLYTASGSTHRPTNGNHNNDMGGYPINNLIDCSYAAAVTEWCYLPNAQTGQFYILLITNYNGNNGNITFSTVASSTTATTDCSLLALVSSNGPLCEGGSIQLICNNPQPNATYSWSGPNGFTSTLQNPTIPNATTANNGTYSLVLSVNNVTSSPATTTITINPLPTVLINAPTTSICLGDSITLTASGATTYSWNSSLGNGNTKRVNPLTTTTYMVTGTQFGCSDTTSFTLNVRSNPTTDITVPSVINCPNIGSINVQTTTSGGEPTYNYTWSGLGVNTSSTSQTNVQIDSSNCNKTYRVKVNVSDYYGCRTADTATFVIRDTTDPVFNTLPFPIQYAEGTYPNYTVPNLTNIVRANSYDNCWASSQLTITQSLIAGSSVNSNSYTIVTVTDPCGNSVSTYIRIIIPLYISITDTIHVNCNGGNNGSATVSATGGIGPYSYNWSTTPSQNVVQAGSLSAGNYQITVTDSLGITLTSTVTILQPTPIILSTSCINPDCYGTSTGSITASSSGGGVPYQYLWNNLATTASITELTVGTYQVTITDANGCTKTNSTSLTQPSIIQCNCVSTPNRCNLSNGSLTITATGGVLPYSYLWNTEATGASLNNLDEGTYICTITDHNGCVKTVTDTIKNINPLKIMGSSAEFETCNMHNGSIELTIEDGALPYQYYWTKENSEGTILNMLSSGLYTITVTDQSGCEDTVSVSVGHFIFNSSIINKTPAICERDDGSITIGVTGGSGNYQIDWGVINDHTENHADNLSPGNYTIYIQDSVCIDTLEFIINEIPKPIACIDNEMNNGILIHQSILLYNCSSLSTHYKWVFGDGTFQLNQQPNHFYTSSGLFPVQLFAYNDYNCVDSALTHVLVNDVSIVYIPNSFTPNNDGINDVFLPICSYISENGYSLQIFDRWGSTVFMSTELQNGWDGTIEGKLAPCQPYSYILHYENGLGQQFRKVGVINLIR